MSVTDEIAKLQELIKEQKGTITALNMALGGEDSTSTENLIEAHEVDYAEEGLIALCRSLTKENVRLEDVVLFQKKDAERYHWVRNSGHVFLKEGPDNYGWFPSYDVDIDEAADTALKGK